MEIQELKTTQKNVLIIRERKAREKRCRFFAARQRAMAEYGSSGFSAVGFHRAVDNERAPLHRARAPPHNRYTSLSPCRPRASAFPRPAALDVNRWARSRMPPTTWHVLGHVDRPHHPRDVPPTPSKRECRAVSTD